MAETRYSQENIAAIRTRLDNIEKMTRLSIASNPNSGAHIADVFRRRAGSASLYLALESGPKSQEELAHALGKNQSTISRILVHLYESGLIEDAQPRSRTMDVARLGESAGDFTCCKTPCERWTVGKG